MFGFFLSLLLVVIKKSWLVFSAHTIVLSYKQRRLSRSVRSLPPSLQRSQRSRYQRRKMAGKSDLGEDVELVTSPLVVPGTGRKVIADVKSHRFERVEAKNRLDGLPQTFQFEIEPSATELTDLQDTFIYFRWSMKQQDNDGSLKDIPTEQFKEKVDEEGMPMGEGEFENNRHLVVPEPGVPLNMFQDAYCTINDVPFPAHSQGLYYYSLYWRYLLESSPAAQATCLMNQSNFFPRAPGMFEDMFPRASGNNKSLMYLKSISNGSKQADTLAPLLTDFTSFRRALPPSTKIEISLDRARCTQYIMSSNPNQSKVYDIEVHEAYLIVKRLTLDPAALESYNAMLSKAPAIFPYVKRSMRAMDIPRSSVAYEFDVGSPGTQLPYQIRFGLVRKKAFDGDYSKSAYNFERFGLQQLRIKEANGFISSEISLKEGNNLTYVPASSLPAVLDGGFSTETWMDKGLSLSQSAFKNGYAIYTLDLSRCATAQDPDPDLLSMPRREKVSVILDFDSKTSYDVVLVLEEFGNNVMRIGSGQNFPSFD